MLHSRNLLLSVAAGVALVVSPGRADAQSSAAQNANAAGNESLERGKLESAIEKYEKALKIADAANDTQYRAMAMYGLARANARLCRVELAEKWFRDSISVREAIPDVPQVAFLTQNWIEFGRFLASQSRPKDAARYFALALPRLDEMDVGLTDAIGYAEFLDDYAAALGNSGGSEEAKQLTDKAKGLREKHPGMRAAFKPVPYPRNCQTGTPPSSAVTSSADSVEDIRQKADAGDAQAAFVLATRYDYGTGTRRDPQLAANWYRRSAELGNAEAQNSLGSLYQAGQGVPRSFKDAFDWYQKAAAQGHVEATHNLAFLYDEGKGVAEDNVRAIELYTQSAEKGFVNSMINLGVMYAQGDGIPTNNKEAYKWLDLARFYTQFSRNMRVKWTSRGLLDNLKKRMSASDIAAAEKLANEWNKAHAFH